MTTEPKPSVGEHYTPPAIANALQEGKPLPAPETQKAHIDLVLTNPPFSSRTTGTD